MTVIPFRCAYDAHARVSKTFEGRSLTEQSHKKDCDVNSILRRYRDVNGRELFQDVRTAIGGVYGDFSRVPSLLEAMSEVDVAVDLFCSLPSSVRKQFSNNPAAFFQFLLDPSNEKEVQALGLLQLAPKEPSGDAVHPPSSGSTDA